MYEYADLYIGQLIDAHPVIFQVGMTVLELAAAKYVFAPPPIINKYILLVKPAEYRFKGIDVNLVVQRAFQNCI
jgi:hypothetical protein